MILQFSAIDAVAAALVLAVMSAASLAFEAPPDATSVTPGTRGTPST
jgi:hypothetical protein